MAAFFLRIILFISGFETLLSAKVLFLFPLPFSSHYRVFTPLIDELASRGHEITAYTSQHFKRKDLTPNFKEIVVHLGPGAPNLDEIDLLELGQMSAVQYTLQEWSTFSAVTEAALKGKELQDLMASEEKYDLIIMQATTMQESLLAFAHKFGAPVINLHPFYVSAYVASLMGAPNPLSCVPDFRVPYTDRMNFFQRTHNAMVGWFDVMHGSLWHLPRQESIMRRLFKYPGSNMLPPLEELVANVSLHLVDAHPMMYVRPYSFNVVDVAGMNIKPAKQLPADIKRFMDEAYEGVIYFSLGSYIEPKMFKENVRRVFEETMKKSKYRVIWKHSEPIQGSPKNILHKSWLPQNEILAHPNCKLFITHGGYNSLVEAMSIGVPVLGLPVFADQRHNVAYYEHMGVGLGADVNSLTTEEFSEKIDRIVNTPSFKENAKKVAVTYRDLPQTSLERAIFWVEYVIRHNGAHHLKPASVGMPLYRYLLLDVIVFWLFIIVLVIYVICKLLALAIRRIKSRPIRK
nr:PREDICTED: 2-hydroxyacylsphingosine 1-beta-galactosyltransferase-like isoform X1 [Bemisia tabaci]